VGPADLEGEKGGRLTHAASRQQWCIRALRLGALAGSSELSTPASDDSQDTLVIQIRGAAAEYESRSARPSPSACGGAAWQPSGPVVAPEVEIRDVVPLRGAAQMKDVLRLHHRTLRLGLLTPYLTQSQPRS
jgi:hypothetical protein